MHEATFNELNSLASSGEVSRILPEHRTTFVNLRTKSLVEGRFDFLMERNGLGKVGFEVLTRPSVGKMLGKLPYSENVDRFVFVLPHNSMEFYRKLPSFPLRPVARPKYFGRNFSSPKLHAWLLDLESGKFVRKGRFSKIFNVRDK